MHQIDFYILHSISRHEKDYLACQLVDKAWHQGYRIYIQTESLMAAQRLDVMLWTLKDDSFLPHDIFPDVSSIAPIQIGYTEQICQGMNVLINMTSTVPSFFEQFQRIVEIIDDTSLAREAGRKRYRFFKEKGMRLKTHDIKR